MLKKIVHFIFSLKPLFLIFLAATFFVILNFYFEDKTSIFDNLSLLFTLCIIVHFPNIIDSFLSNYTNGSRWIIVFGLILATFGLTTILHISEGLTASLVNFIEITLLLSFVLYLLLPPFRGIFNLIKKIKWKFVKRFVAYIERLLNPNYLFPIKLISYSGFYLLWFLFKLITEIIKIIIDGIKFPFKSFRNFLKSLLVVVIIIYLVASIFVMVDYINKNYGYYGKFFCSAGTSEQMKKSVVRIVGGFSEGTGFFISNNQVLTNFHVIDGEPSPKIIFPDGSFITPTKITGDSKSDLAVLYTEKDYPDMVMSLKNEIELKDEEPVIATGFAMGTDLVGKATVLKGNFIDFRKSKTDKVGYLQTSISLVQGMSGGPLTDQCGKVVGINTMGLSGLSLFVSAKDANNLISEFTDKEIEKINVDPTKSPKDSVIAFYAYLKARQMEKGFDLLTKEYLQKTNFEEWTTRFKDVLDVYVYKAEIVEDSKDTVNIKFNTTNWVNNETEYHFYEGTWKTIFEDGKYKMLKSNIKEIATPDIYWFYE